MNIMTEPGGIRDIGDILYDLEGTRRQAEWVEGVFSGGRAAIGPARDVTVRARSREDQGLRAVGPPGDELISCRPMDVRTRYRTVLRLESGFSTDLDHGCLIAAACQILENELSQLLIEPARAVGGALVRALDDAGQVKQAEILQGWADRRVPTTIGIASLVLLALRRAVEGADREIGDFLVDRFRPDFLPADQPVAWGGTLDRVRESFRNPACHGLRTFGPSDYDRFARLIVGRDRLMSWASAGALVKERPGELALLHELLRGSRRVQDSPAEASPIERLLSLSAPRESALSIGLEVHRAEGDAPPRTASPLPKRLTHPFRLGDSVCFTFRSNQDCHLALIDVGTSGKVAVVLPNQWQKSAAVRGSRIGSFPDPDDAPFDFILGGQPGRQRLLALAWQGKLGVALEPTGEDAVRPLSGDDIIGLCDALEAMPLAKWAVCACEFEITDRGAAHDDGLAASDLRDDGP
jgi:hypothetical protein